MTDPIGIAGLGIFVPDTVITAADLSSETGIPADILVEKFGVRQVHRAGPDCHVSDMATAACSAALEDADLSPSDVDLLVYCGSEFKDYIVWSAAAHIAGRLGCDHAEAYEIYALCAGGPLALRVVADMMRAEPSIRTALVVAASKESALVDRRNARSRFMFNFGDGAGAALLRRGWTRNRVLGSASMIDSTLNLDTLMPAGGSHQPTSTVTIAAGLHSLDVFDLEHMRVRLDEVSGRNFARVARLALERSGRERADFLALVQMKRSMHQRIVTDLGIERTIYLDTYGHMQAADQLVALYEARQRGLLREGDIILLLAAGIGYTWSASVVAWGQEGGDGDTSRTT
jgi:3-oxoacyl-[acyl-carrier-protein] synthase-3